MMKKFILTLFFISFTTILFAQSGKPYQIFNKKGKKVTYKKMLKKVKDTDILLFGEHHNNSMIHWLQLQVTKDLQKQRELILGAEMFEADNQKALTDYLASTIDQKAFDTVARLWKNYKTDYKPLVDFAKNNNLHFVASNVPRRNAKIVYRKGFEGLESLSKEEKSWIAPLPVPYDKNLPSYVKMLEMMGGHGGENFPKAQAIKDATMGYFITKNYKANHLFIHYNGSYHSDFYEGINWYINKYNNTLNIKTITTVEQDDLSKLTEEEKSKADFIIVVPTDMTKTY